MNIAQMLTVGFTVLLVVFSVIAHELAHGYAALTQGDQTAQCAGRLTWNPLAHVDPLTTVLLPLVTLLATHGALILGGARPVPVSPRRYRNGIRSDLVVSLAGVAANAVILLACLACLALSPTAAHVALRVAEANAALIVFNLLPIPPLDGWRVLSCVRALLRSRAPRERVVQ